MSAVEAGGIGVVIGLAILNGIAWLVGSPRLSAGFVLGMLGTCISAYLNGYATSPDPGADHNFLTQPSRPGRNFFTPAKPPGHKPSLLARSRAALQLKGVACCRQS